MAASKKDAIAVLPQPYVTAAQLKDSSLRVVLNLTKEWNKVCDTQLITGVTVVRTEYAKENPDIVANFLRDYEKSIKAAQTDIAGTAALCEETGVVAKKAIAQKALPQCNIVYRVGDEMKADVNAYLKVLYDASPAAVAASCRMQTSTTPRPRPARCSGKASSAVFSKPIKRRAVQPHGSF